MWIKEEQQKNAQGLPDLLLYSSLIEPGILSLYDGALHAGWRYWGQDLGCWSIEEQRGLAVQISKILCLGSGWMVETNAIRREVAEYPKRNPDAHPVAQAVDEERRRQFLSPKSKYRTEYYLSLTYLPPTLREQKAQSLFTPRAAVAGKNHLQANTLAYFKRTIEDFEASMGAYVEMRRLLPVAAGDGCWQDHTLLRFLRDCIQGEDYPFSAPLVPVDLNLLMGVDFVSGEQPIIDRKLARVVAVERYPAASWPGMFRAMEQLPFAYRWHTRSLLLDPEVSKAIHDKHRKQWHSSQRGVWSSMLGMSGSPNPEAEQMEASALQAMSLASGGQIQFGAYNAKVILSSDPLDPHVIQLVNKGITGEAVAPYRDAVEQLNQQTKVIANVMRAAGFTPRVETMNAPDALRGSWPGHGYSDLRVGPVHTINFAEAMPLSRPFTGLEYNSSSYMPPRTEPLLMASTDGDTPYRWHPAVGDVPHSLMIGPTRTGKSAMLALQCVQWLTRYPNGQVFAFDKKESLKNLALAMGAKHFSPGSSRSTITFCPLQEIDTPWDQTWAELWVSGLLEANKFRVTAAHRNLISETIKRMATRSSRNNRSLTAFSALLGSKELQGELQFYTMGSVSSEGLLDGTNDGLGLHETNFAVFELDKLFEMDQRMVKATLSYLFHVVTKQLDTRRPTLIPIDEAWMALAEPSFAEILRSWLKELAKMNAGVLLATQNLSDFFQSPLKAIIVDQCATRIYLPNSSAVASSREQYADMGLTLEQRTQIAEGVAQRDYFIQSNQGGDRGTFRRVELDLCKVALSFLGSNSDEDRERFADLMEREPEKGPAIWLTQRGHKDWGAYLGALIEKQKEGVYACA